MLGITISLKNMLVKKPKPVSYFSKQADKVLQEIGRKMFNKCLVCGRDMSCLHHYYPKSSAGNLRYNFLNLIPICQGCHFRHHNGYPEIHNKINEAKGGLWLRELNLARQKQDYQCNTRSYYIAKKIELDKLLEQYE